LALFPKNSQLEICRFLTDVHLVIGNYEKYEKEKIMTKLEMQVILASISKNISLESSVNNYHNNINNYHNNIEIPVLKSEIQEIVWEPPVAFDYGKPFYSRFKDVPCTPLFDPPERI
jgi:hypothetical protein